VAAKPTEGAAGTIPSHKRILNPCRQSSPEARDPAHDTTTALTVFPGPLPIGFNEWAVCRSGMMLFNRHDQYVGASLRKYGECSIGETNLFGVLIQPGMTVLEIGANIGMHTIDLSRLAGPTGAVHAFEPQRLVFQSLCANVALNSCANVFTYHTAVGAAAGSALVPWLDPNAGANFGGLSLLDAQQGERVSQIAIDQLGLDACDFIKVDVEGMEIEALLGAAATIARTRPIKSAERSKRSFST
jgi:FkbM family methyltransferase